MVKKGIDGQKVKGVWLETNSPDLIWLGNVNKQTIMFDHMSHVCEEFIVKTNYAIKTKNKNWSRDVAIFRITEESSGSLVFHRLWRNGLATKTWCLGSS